MITLSDLSKDGKLLWAYCNNCGRERDIDPAANPLPPDFPVHGDGPRMKCSRCGMKVVTTAPELYPGGIFAQRQSHG
jgi:hypothetical protein